MDFSSEIEIRQLDELVWEIDIDSNDGKDMTYTSQSNGRHWFKQNYKENVRSDPEQAIIYH